MAKAKTCAPFRFLVNVAYLAVSFSTMAHGPFIDSQDHSNWEDTEVLL